MKSNKMMRIASVLLVAVILSTCAISGTFAKYTSTATGSDTASVAKWDIKVEGTQIAVSPAATVSFDVFNTLKEADGTTAEANVSATDGSLIAPGTGGSFELNVVNNSEVSAEYKVTYTQTNNSNIPVEFTLTPNDANSWKSDIADLSMSDFAAIAMTNGTADITIYWRWDFDGDDTALGIAAQTAAPTFVVNATITVNQVD